MSWDVSSDNVVIPFTLSTAVEVSQDHSELENLDYESSGHTGFQAAISDLATIRSGAAAGATALQDAPSDGKTYGRKDGSWSEVTGGSGTSDHAQLTHLDYASSGHTGFASSADLASKQDAISDLAAIRSGAALGATALQSVPSTYRTSAAQDAIDATKQDTITSSTDLTANSLAVGRVTDKDGDAALAEYVNGEWYLGDASTPVNATDAQYFTVPQVDASGAQDQAATKQYVDEQDATKQDAISDLSAIRSGAALGATAYQKPASGIPKTDLASGVQTSLGLADTALQSHQSLAAYRTSSAQDTIDATKLPQDPTDWPDDWTDAQLAAAHSALSVDSNEWELLADVTTTEDVSYLYIPCTYSQIFGNTRDAMIYVYVPAQTSLSSDPIFVLAMAKYIESTSAWINWNIIGGSSAWTSVSKAYWTRNVVTINHAFGDYWTWRRNNNWYNSNGYSRYVYGSVWHSKESAEILNASHLRLSIGTNVPTGTIVKIYKKKG